MTARQLREKRANLAEQAKEIVDRAEAEGRAMTAEEDTAFARYHDEIEALRTTIDAIERQSALDSELGESRSLPGREDTRVSDDEAEDRRQRHEAAFRAYLIGGEQDLTLEQRTILRETRVQGVAPDAAGGFTVPAGFSGQLEESMLAHGGMRAAATVFQTASGNALPWPTVDDTAQKGVLLAEHAVVAEQALTFSVVTFRAYKYSSRLVRVSVELLQDSAFDLVGFLARALGTRIARITNEHFTRGTGTAQPLGVVTAAGLGRLGAAGQTTSVTYGDLVDLQHSVDPAYREGAVWMMHDLTIRSVKRLTDTTGRPLWAPGIEVREPDTILGHRYIANQDMPVMAASARSILFGDLRKYLIRDVLGVTVLRLNERYADSHQVGFLAFSRHDGNLLDAGTDPVRFYQNSAT